MDVLQKIKPSNFHVFLLIMAIVPESYATELNLTFQQSDYQLYFERAEVIRYNKEIIKEFSVKTFKYNRTLAVLNATGMVVLDVGNSLEALIDVHKFLSNEYRFFGIHFQMNMCKAFAENVGGVKTAALRCGNVIGCPLRKGIKYSVCNFYPDQSKLPPYIPNGQYRVDIQFLHFSQEVGFARSYATVSRPIV